jgi:enoyl-CoA hydratase
VAALRVATHYMPSELIPALIKQLEAADFSGGAADLLNEILGRLSHAVPAGSFEAHRAVIDRCFAFDRAEDILAALDADGGDWARTEAATLRAKSPETVKVALRQLREGRKAASFEDNMRMEFRIGWRKVQSADFLEGVRAVIIDKDNAPVWKPSRLEDVSESDVARYFAPLGTDELTFGR